MRVGSRPPARVRPARMTRAKGRPLWRVEVDPRTGRPRTTRPPARKRRRRLPPRSRHRRRPRAPPRLPKSRRHQALRLRAISLRLLSNGNRSPRPLRRGTGSATGPPLGSRAGGAQRPRRRPHPLPRPPRTCRARESQPTSGGRTARRSHPARSLRAPPGRRAPLDHQRQPASTGRPAHSRRRRCRPNRRRLRPLDLMRDPGSNRARRRRRWSLDRRRLRLPGLVSSPDRLRATMSRTALATRCRPGRLGRGPRALAART
jgi:hypothetical protein